MARLKTSVISEKSILNTTISKDVLEKFKDNCKLQGISMNVLIESFMRQYNDGEFYFKLGTNKSQIEEK